MHGRFKTPPQRMPGVRLGQVFDPVTSQMYTLYSNRPGAYADAYEDTGGTNPYGGASYGSDSGASGDSGRGQAVIGEDPAPVATGPRRPSCTC